MKQKAPEQKQATRPLNAVAIFAHTGSAASGATINAMIGRDKVRPAQPGI
jgi:hypothetical protein